MYEPTTTEQRWQGLWAERRTNEPDLDAARGAEALVRCADPVTRDREHGEWEHREHEEHAREEMHPEVAAAPTFKSKCSICPTLRPTTASTAPRAPAANRGGRP